MAGAGMGAVLTSGDTVGGRYAVDALLARGGMADVYRAHDRLVDRPVALKMLRAGTAEDHRFDVEARLLARFKHGNLIRLLDAGQSDGAPYLVLELVEGPTLADRLRGGALDSTEVRHIGSDIARALAYVHAGGVIHRDVKPSNVLLSPDGRALLGDFGVARLAGGTRLTATKAIVGTVAYLAPEQLDGGEVTTAADVYALGLVLMEALSGEPAFRGTHREVLAARLARNPSMPPGVPRHWVPLLSAMTRRDPAARPDAADVAERLATSTTAGRADLDTAPMTVTDWDGDSPGAQPDAVAATVAAPPRHRAPGNRPSQNPVLWTLIGLATFVALVVSAVGFNYGDDEPPAGRPDATASLTTTDPATPSTTNTTATTSAASGQSTSTQPPPATSCADLDARRQQIEEEKRQVQQTYRGDKDTRERLKSELDDEKQAIDTQRQAQGC
jgi:eukaryotic-like serine/threonine-protein kinase